MIQTTQLLSYISADCYKNCGLPPFTSKYSVLHGTDLGVHDCAQKGVFSLLLNRALCKIEKSLLVRSGIGSNAGIVQFHVLK